MMDSAKDIDRHFIDRVSRNDLPKLMSAQQGPHTEATLDDSSSIDPDQLLEWFDSQLMSRQLDLWARRMQPLGKVFYSIGSSGHEGMAAVAAALRPTDLALLHYRDCAFQIQRANQLSGQQPLRDLCLSFVAAAADPVSGGRHKVLGSKALNIPPQTSTIASHLPKAVGAAYGIGLSRTLNHASPYPSDSLVVCSFGDASLNHSTAQGAINSTCWIANQGLPLPLILICEDNGLGISTPTPSGWIEASCRHRPGLHYLSCNGLDLVDTYHRTRQAITLARQHRQPVLLHFRCIRLLGHAGADAELNYLNRDQIEANYDLDPLLVSAAQLIERQRLSPDQLCQRYRAMAERVSQAGDWAIKQPPLRGSAAISASLTPAHRATTTTPTTTTTLATTLATTPTTTPATADTQPRDAYRAQQKTAQQQPQPMARLLNWALADAMFDYPEIILMGQDIGPKGGVYQITQSLHRRFGSQRVINTLLDEQSILGLAIGFSHHGLLPIAEIQFLAYVHNAEDQIRGEAATLSFFSNGQYANPMLIRIAGLGYQKGFGGHFHNDNSLAVFLDIPGLILACPSNGRDAVLMLRECIRLAREEQRLVVFIEPIALYRCRDLQQPDDQRWCYRYDQISQQPPLSQGQPHCHGTGTDLCLLSYANGYFLSRQSAEQLAQQGIRCRVIDLRWLKPLDIGAIAALIKPCQTLLIVDECRRSGSISAQLYTELSEQCDPPLQISRLTADDCLIPLGAGATDTLPSVNSIIDAAIRCVRRHN